MKYTESYIEKQLEAIQRVRELHKNWQERGLCEHCEDSNAGSGMMKYPCPTIQALDGEQ